LEAQILNIHDLNTNLNYLSSNVLSLYYIFDVQNIVLCLNRELIKIIDYKRIRTLNWILLIWEGAAFEEDGNIFEIKIVLKITL
jgi:hypothetical protein